MIIFFYGEDDFRAKKKIKELRERFSREVDITGGGFEYLDGEKTTLREINEKTAASSLWSAKRMVVIENVFRTKTKDLLPSIAEYFQKREKSGNENIIVFLENFLKTKKNFSGSPIVRIDLDGREKPLTKAEKQLAEFLDSAQVKQEFKKMNSTEMAGWIKKNITGRGGKISDRAVICLIALTSGDLWQIDNEINKLINYKASLVLPCKNNRPEAPEIDEDDVKSLVRGRFEENIFALTDAIGARNRALAAKLLEEELQGGANGVYILSMILRQIKMILQIASAMSAKISENQLSGELKLNSYVARKAAVQSRNFLPAQLKKMLADLLEIDYRIKSGQGDPAVLLGLWISKI